MRIINCVLGDASGGRWQVVCDYSRVLSQAGHRVQLLLDRRHLPDQGRLPSGVEVCIVRNRGHYDYLAAWQVSGLLHRFSPDVAIAHCSRSVSLLKRSLGGCAPLVAVSHSNKVRRLLAADSCIALTRHIYKKMAAGTRAGDRKQLFVIPNMVPADRLSGLPRRSPGIPQRIAAMGRFDTVKGFDVFVEALGILRQRGLDFIAQLAGCGEQETALKKQSELLGLRDRLSFPGWIEDTPSFLAGVDILCVPARSDAFGLTPLEAAAAGVPLVLSRASGHVEMFAKSQVLFAETGNPIATADRLQQLLDSSVEAEKCRTAAFQHVQEFYSESVVTDKLFQAIEKTIEIFNTYN